MTNKEAAIKIIKRLRSNGFEALLAGGCVRDMLMRRAASDYDVATSAHPEDVTKMFKRTLKVGAKFGVVIVLIDDKQVEVATFRTETGYADGRHPSAVKFVSAAEDASRRDFTINGMFYDPLKKEVIDYVNGRADLKKELIRTIGKPAERFGEDYLRMLRAVRFSTQLGFAIELRTFSAICSNSKRIAKVSGERIAMELEAILVSPNRSAGVSLLVKSGLAKAIFPGFGAEDIKFGIKVLAQLRKKSNFSLSLACLFAGCSTEFAIEKCACLKLSRSQTRHIKFLLDNRGKLLDEDMSLSQLKLIVSEPYFGDLYELQRAIQKAERKSAAPLISLRKRIKALGDVELRPKPLLDGHALIRLGAVQGPELGQLAEEMYTVQLEGKVLGKEQAEQWVKNWLKRHKLSDM
ncbi:MAG: CCA tRNA nucleotidyltransferase [Phycisphaerae bacterium]|nr:CCA tRNA nucleotidyltransferase [Phycisphaerae bacterium]MDD5381226.1 CCA tRNA nucleotidyltransferase [Phycisphaerae bacterium]